MTMDDDDAIVLAGYGGYGETVGARRRGGGRAPAPMVRRMQAIAPDAGQVGLDQVMPFPNGTFTLTVGNLNLTAQPQRKFQLARLVIDTARIGATATGIVQVTQLTVGAEPQFVNTGSVPSSMFSSVAVGIHLRANAARPGVTVTLSLSITPLPLVADTVVVSSAAVGPALA
jgi:hypothetical protein